MPSITLKAVLDKRPLSDGTHTVYIRITMDREQRYTATGVRTLKKDFNENGIYEKSNWIRGTASNNANDNNDIRNTIDKIKNITKEDPDISLDTLIKQLKGKNTGDFIEYWKEFLAIKNKGVKDNTAKRYEGHVKTFCEFNNNKPVKFSDINEKLINDYEAWQLKKNSRETVKKSISVLRRVIEYAYKKKKIKENPFDDYSNIKGGKTEKIPLSIEEIVLFENKRLYYPDLADYANTFLLQYHCAGARIRDILQMKWSDIRDGRWFYSMNKTERGMNIILSEKAIEILSEYKGKNGEYVLPWIPQKIDTWKGEYYKLTETITTTINRKLKSYCSKIGITKKVSTHIARHSFSKIAEELMGGNIVAPSKAMGHSSIRMTASNYLPAEDQKAVDAVLIRMSNTDFNMNEEEMKQLHQLLTKIIRSGKRSQLQQLIDRIV